MSRVSFSVTIDSKLNLDIEKKSEKKGLKKNQLIEIILKKGIEDV